MRVADSVVLKEPRFCGVFFGLVPGFSADVAVGCRVAAAPYPAYEYSCSPGKRSATGENRQGRINPGIGKHGALCFWRVLKDLESDGGGGRITRRVAPRPSGRCLRQRFLATLESNLGRSFSSFPALEKHGALCFWRVLKDLESDGGGGRIRTFEVDDGRFTVCSLWPLGNPTRVIHILR